MRPFGQTEERACRVLEVGYQVQELDGLPRLCRPLPDVVEVLEADPVWLELDPNQFCLHVLERRNRTCERWELDQHDVARTDQNAGDEIDALLRSTRHDELLEGCVDRPAFQHV